MRRNNSTQSKISYLAPTGQMPPFKTTVLRSLRWNLVLPAEEKKNLHAMLILGADGNSLTPDWTGNEMLRKTVIRDHNDGRLQQEVLTVPEVAAILRCSKAHAHNLINGRVKGTPAIPAIAAGRRRLVERASLAEWRRKSQLHLPGDDGGEATIRIPAETLQAILDLAKDHGLSLEQALECAIRALKSGLKTRT